MKLEVLIGMIASGKSTYARKRADEGALVVCHDDLTQMLHARYRYEPELRAVYRCMMTSLTAEALGAGRDVIADRTHLTRESRAIWLGFRNYAGVIGPGLKIVAVVLPIHPASTHAQRRFDADPRGRPYAEWLGVALHHAKQDQDEPLDWKAEGFDECVQAPPFAASAPDDPTPQPPRA